MKMKDYNGQEYEVIKISSDYEDVRQYDGTGACSDCLEMKEDTTIFIACKDTDGDNVVWMTEINPKDFTLGE